MRIISDPFEQFVAAPVFALVWLLLGWSYCRVSTGGRALGARTNAWLGYGFVFFLGLGYLMAWHAQLRALFGWRWAWLVLAIAWSALVVYVAWRRSRRTQSKSVGTLKSGLSSFVRGLPAIALLVCLVGSGVEWELVVKGHGHFMVAVLWTAGIATAVALAGRNRRRTVVGALRAFLALLVVGALAQQSLAALVVAGVVATGLFLLGKVWTSKSATLDPEAFAPSPGDHNPSPPGSTSP